MPILRSVAVLLALAVGLAACEHTIRGAGRDLQETGEAIEDVAEQ